MTTHDEPTTTSDHAEFAPPEAWDALAEGYAAHVAPGEEPFATAALHLAGLEPGLRFLDVAAGTGGLSLPAARLGADVLATDWAPAMIAQFEARVRAERLSRAEGRVMDAHDLDLDDDGFDVTGSQFGVMLMPNQAQALREMVRVTRPGGRVLLVAYGPPAEFEALQFFVGALQAVVTDFEGLPEDPPPLEFQVADPQEMSERLTAAGLSDVRVDTSHEERVEFRSGQDCWDWMLNSNPIAGMIVGELSEQQRVTVREVLHGMIRDRAQGATSVALTARLNIGVGRKE